MKRKAVVWKAPCESQDIECFGETHVNKRTHCHTPGCSHPVPIYYGHHEHNGFCFECNARAYAKPAPWVERYNAKHTSY